MAVASPLNGFGVSIGRPPTTAITTRIVVVAEGLEIEDARAVGSVVMIGMILRR